MNNIICLLDLNEGYLNGWSSVVFEYAREHVSEGICVWVSGPGGKDLPSVWAGNIQPAGHTDGK